tara:strand:- start:1789 stop:2055 length:267 start_codon:yes stop_codon:yes gene_type:complete
MTAVLKAAQAGAATWVQVEDERNPFSSRSFRDMAKNGGNADLEGDQAGIGRCRAFLRPSWQVPRLRERRIGVVNSIFSLFCPSRDLLL